MNSYAVLIPRGIDVEELVNIYSPSLDVNYLKYLIHYVLSKLSFLVENTDKKVSVFKSYIAISSAKLLVRHNKHRKHIRFLGELLDGVVNIFHRERYAKDKSYSYKISPYYQKEDLVVQNIKDSKLINKIISSESKLPSVFKSGKYKFLRKYFNARHLRIDIDEAVKLCESRYQNHKEYKKYLHELVAIVELYNGIYRVYYSKDTDARLHTNISRLPKVYRKYVTYKGKQLVEVDLSNSIIYFLAMLTDVNSNVITDNISSLLYMFNKSLETIDVKEKELVRELALSGKFYNHFISEFDEVYEFDEYKKIYEYDNDDEYLGTFKQRRKIVKKRLLAMLFAEEDSYLKEQEIFKNQFPELLSKIVVFKKQNGYKKLSHILLQFESECMLNIAARAFNKKYYRNAPIFTLHDCLITTICHKNELEYVMETEYQRILGCAPKIEAETWS